MNHDTSTTERPRTARFADLKPGDLVEFQTERMLSPERGTITHVGDLVATVGVVNRNGGTEKAIHPTDWVRVIAPGGDGGTGAAAKAQESECDPAKDVAAAPDERKAALIRRIAEIVRERQCGRLFALGQAMKEFPEFGVFAKTDNAAEQKIRDWAKRYGIELPKASRRRHARGEGKPRKPDKPKARKRVEVNREDMGQPAAAYAEDMTVTDAEAKDIHDPITMDKPEAVTPASPEPEPKAGCGARLRMLAGRVRERVGRLTDEAEAVAARAETLEEELQAVAWLIAGHEGNGKGGAS